jgi:hypothetical protein
MHTAPAVEADAGIVPRLDAPTTAATEIVQRRQLPCS